MMGINRRQFLSFAAAGISGCCFPGAVSASFGQARVSSTNPDTLLLSACDDQQQQHWISGWHWNGTPLFRIAVPHRAHAVSVNPVRQQAIFFARRPGTELYIVELNNPQLAQTISSPAGYHFFGHGVFSADGKQLFTTENAYNRGHGVIGIYDTTDYQRIGEYHSGNIGPHQLAMLSDNKTLVIANGGILTHPDQPRKKLNIDSMQSSLVYLNSQNGNILEQFLPQHPQMSIRHLAVSSDDHVVMGVQFQGASSELLPLVLSHRGEEQLQPMLADELHWLSQNQYIASIAIDSQDQIALTTSPRGNNISLWNMTDRTLIASHSLKDVAGAEFSVKLGTFMLSNGNGQIALLDPKQPEQLQNSFTRSDVRWDNHLALVNA